MDLPDISGLQSSASTFAGDVETFNTALQALDPTGTDCQIAEALEEAMDEAIADLNDLEAAILSVRSIATDIKSAAGMYRTQHCT